MRYNLKVYNIMSSYSNSRTSRVGPPMVVADLPNGCESTACYIAQTFYNCCRNEITKINNRNQLREFFVKSQRFWMPPELTERGENRHFDQVLNDDAARHRSFTHRGVSTGVDSGGESTVDCS